MARHQIKLPIRFPIIVKDVKHETPRIYKNNAKDKIKEESRAPEFLNM